MWYSLAIAPRDGAVAFMFKKVAEIDIVWKPKNAWLFTPTEERDNQLSYGLKTYSDPSRFLHKDIAEWNIRWTRNSWSTSGSWTSPRTRRMEHQSLAWRGGRFLRCWSMVYPSGVKCNPQSLLKKCARTWWSSWPFAQTRLLIVSYQPHQRTTNKIQNKTSGENATAGTPPEQAPEEAAGQQYYRLEDTFKWRPILERISLKGGTPLITWCVEKCLPFSRVKWNPPIFGWKNDPEMVLLLAFRSDRSSYRLVSSSSECMNENTRWECSSRGRAREPCGGGRRTDNIKKVEDRFKCNHSRFEDAAR